MRELLLLLCNYPFDEKNRGRLTKLVGEVSGWHKMIKLINAHGIIALAAYNIKECGLEKEIPDEAMAALENGYMQSVLSNSWLTERWREVNTILCNTGIKHILLKGMALEHTLYGSKGLRQMNDNDILIKREDAIKAWHLLQQIGFTHEIIKSGLYNKILADTGKHLPCLYKNGYAIEIQMIHLTDHFERHAMEGGVQIRQYADIILLDKNTRVIMPETFIANPQQQDDLRYRKAVCSVPIKYRLRYVAGDIFPSIKWMKERYGCNGMKVLLYYPHRMGKLFWLV